MNPLENVDVVASSLLSQNYYLKVVPTVYLNGTTTLTSNQYSVNSVPREVGVSPFGQVSALPGIFFIYDLTPFMHIITDQKMTLAHFLVRCCAVIGGVAAVGIEWRERRKINDVDCEDVGYNDVLPSKNLIIQEYKGRSNKICVSYTIGYYIVCLVMYICSKRRKRKHLSFMKDCIKNRHIIRNKQTNPSNLYLFTLIFNTL